MKLLIIEDEYSLADAISEIMKKENFVSTIITNGRDGENEALTGIYDLIILDVMLPYKNGFDILKTLKDEKIKTPIIMLTAKSEIENKLNGLENGADDYITKPFNMKELVARSKNIVKRSQNLEDFNILELGNLKLNLKTNIVSTPYNEILISGKEFYLLEILMANKNCILNKEMIINKIWGYETDSDYNYVEVYVSFLRKKLKLINSNVNIRTIRGVGYKLEVDGND